MKNRVFTYASSLLLAALVLFAGMSTVSADGFTDMEDGDFGYTSVQYLVDNGIIKGFPNGEFRPNQSVNRADTAVMFQRMLELPVPAGEQPFNDVEAHKYYADAAHASYDAGIFLGGPGSVFGPADHLTREQMASVIVRAFNLERTDTEVTLTDLDAAHPVHVGDIETLNTLGIAKGRTGGIYDPKAAVSRVEFSVFLYRLLMPVPEPADPGDGEDPPEDGEPGDGDNDDGSGAPTPDPAPVDPEATSSSITLGDGTTVNADVTNNGTNTVQFDLSSLPGTTTFTAGTITVNENSTLRLRGLPIAEMPEEEYLTAGENSLAVADVLSENDVLLATIRAGLGNRLRLYGTLTSDEGKVTDIEIIFQLQ